MLIYLTIVVGYRERFQINSNIADYHQIKSEKIMDIFRIIASVIIPPLGVFLQVGLSRDFWINVVLTLLGYFPGLIHAVWIIGKT